MIRFSAALVAVAIGVLIGGIATSKLLLVYIAIVVSAVALVALAIGVALKREELFGERQELLPAGAGAGPVLQARAGEGQDRIPVSAHVAPPPPFQGAAGGHAAAFGGTAPAASSSAASSSAAADPSAARTAAARQGRPADPVPPWNTPAARGPWSSSAPDWMHSGPDERVASAAGGAGGRAPSARQDTTPAGTPGGRVAGWGVPDADTQAAQKAPRSWAGPSSPSVSSDPPAVKPGAGPATPSWFDRLGSQAGAEAPAGAPAPAPAPAPGTGWSWASRDSTAPGAPVAPEATEGTGAPATVAAPTISSGTVPDSTVPGETASGDAGAGDEDDDWPTRYSWLDDDTDESGEAAATTATSATEVADVARAGPEGKSPVPGDSAGDTAGDAGPDDVAPVTASAPGTASSAAETADAATTGAAAGDRADAAEGSDADIIAFPRPAASGLSQATDPGPHDGLAGEPVADGGATAAGETESGPPAAAEGGAAPEAGLVTVVPGVPRYHRTDCVLIRFMPEGDVQMLSVTAAKDAGCTPCAACQPEG